MTTPAYATEANVTAAGTRTRAFQAVMPCPPVAMWSPISLGSTADRKHGQPRRTKASP